MAASKLLIFIILLGLIFCNYNINPTSEQIKINNPRVIPKHIKVGTFFKGLQVRVKAEIPEYSGVVVKLVGKDEEMVLNKKGKKTFIWLNVAQVIVKNAPSIYILACSEELNELCPRVEQKREQLGYNSLKEKVTFESTKPLSGIEFNEFIKLKEHSGYYNINNNAVINSVTDGKHILEATLDIPSFISAGKYNVVIYCFNDGNLIDKAIVSLSIEKVELPLFITNLANGSPAIYGILAIIVAIIAGGIIGLIFIKKRNSEN